MKKNILMVLNYYYPYISGVSEVARLLSEELVAQGHTVTVLCSNHDHLPKEEVIHGVQVIRAPIQCKISKGTVSFQFISWAVKLARQADIVNLHAPMLESGIITALIGGEKCVTTYQCDIDLAKGFINSLIKWGMNRMNAWGLKNTSRILVTTRDYGMHSRFAGKYPDKLVEVRGPIKDYTHVEVLRSQTKQCVGFCGRIVMEKGIDVLIHAFAMVKEKLPAAQLLIGGDYANVAGGSIYPELEKIIAEEKISDVLFLGKIPEDKMAEFYSGLDVFVLPSINPLEAFGLVQVEAMYCGTPVVASDLYGVRTIVQNTGMGMIHKKGDAEDLARCIIEILTNPKEYQKDREWIRSMYSTAQCVKAYETAYDEVIDQRNGK